jgi:hypothetical protein
MKSPGCGRRLSAPIPEGRSQSGRYTVEPHDQNKRQHEGTKARHDSVRSRASLTLRGGCATFFGFQARIMHSTG